MILFSVFSDDQGTVLMTKYILDSVFPSRFEKYDEFKLTNFMELIKKSKQSVSINFNRNKFCEIFWDLEMPESAPFLYCTPSGYSIQRQENSLNKRKKKIDRLHLNYIFVLLLSAVVSFFLRKQTTAKYWFFHMCIHKKLYLFFSVR